MLDWTLVKWTEARQIAQVLEWEHDLGGDACLAPKPYFSKLVRERNFTLATLFAGQALPRYNAVAWAAGAVRDLQEGTPAPGPDNDALKAALLWVQDPSEARRRTAFEVAGRVRRPAAGRLAALAAFFSGGSITPVDSPPVQPPKAAAGRFAAGAVLLAAMATADPNEALLRVLDAEDAFKSSATGL